jgi:serine/threonine protein kinase
MKRNNKTSYNETMRLLSSSSSSSSSSSPSLSPSPPQREKVNEKPVEQEHVEVIKTIIPSPVFTIDEIIGTIIKYTQEAELYHLTHWDNMSKFMLKTTITNIHSHNEKEYLKDFIIYKQYDAVEKQSTVIKYGMFKHKYLNLMFRIDDIDDQISGEDNVSSILMEKYKNKYKDIIRLGIVIPMYCHIKFSNPQLFYSIQPYITDTVTFDKWISLIKHKGNFDELVYDAFMQLSAILQELHEVDCVHGDIKPANILVSNKNGQISIFLIDFGLSGIHNKTTNASGGTLPFCAPETYNTIANTRNGNNVIKYPQHFQYNWVKHNKSHDIWSLGFIFMTVYIFKSVKLYYHDYPIYFFLSTGYISPNYFHMVKHEYIREILSEHILVEPHKRCDIFKLNNLISNLSFM